jgi:hypothetical protein
MDILETALFEMCRKKKNKFFYPEDIIREMYPEAWKHFFPELKILVRNLYDKGEIEIDKTYSESYLSDIGKCTFKIRCLSKPKS